MILSLNANVIKPVIASSAYFVARLLRYRLQISLGLAVLVTILLPLNLLSSQRLHHDEALYGTWALKIVSGDDPWLHDTPIDKPPLFLYTVAGVMALLGVTETSIRLPSLVATVLMVMLTFWLGRKLYGNGVGILAAWLMALSPFTILFAPTAFTDPMLVALVLASCLAATAQSAGWAGVCLGLAIATKQQGLFFGPLVLTLLLSRAGYRDTRSTDPDAPPDFLPHRPYPAPMRLRPALTFFLASLVTVLPALIWDFSRSQPSAFFEQSLNNYGGLSADLAGFNERWQGFLELLYYGTASPVLNIIFLVGTPILLLHGLGSRLKGDRAALFDWFLALFALAFVLLHALLSFQVWDRYLLGLMPLLALVLARVLLLPCSILKSHMTHARPALPALLSMITALLICLLLAFTLPAAGQDAAHARYPLGSNSHAVRGIEQITAYLRGSVGADSTLYHRWLGTHWRFYLWGYPYDLQYWETPADLLSKAQPGQLIAYPAWRSDTELRLALFKAGLRLRELTQAYAPNGAPTITLFRLETIP